jgi:hypothetical protein
MTDEDQPSSGDADQQPASPDDSAYEPLPPQGESASDVLARLESERKPAQPPIVPAFDGQQQLSIGQLLFCVFVLSASLAVMRWMDPGLAAGIVGFGLLAMLAWNDIFKLALPLVVQVAWWGMLVLYIVMSFAAFTHTR